MSTTTAVLSDDVLLQRMDPDDHPGPPQEAASGNSEPPSHPNPPSDHPHVVVSVPTMTTDDAFPVNPASNAVATGDVCTPQTDGDSLPELSTSSQQNIPACLSGEATRLEQESRIQQQLFDLLQQQQQHTPLQQQQQHHLHHHLHLQTSNAIPMVNLGKDQSPSHTSPQQQRLLAEEDLKTDLSGPDPSTLLSNPSSATLGAQQEQTPLPNPPSLPQHPLHPLHQLPSSVLHAVTAPPTQGLILPGHHHPSHPQPAPQQPVSGSQPGAAAGAHVDGNSNSVSEFELARRLGVRFDSSNAAWVARWVDPQNDRKKSRWFSIAKYGNAAARRLAIQACLHNMKPSDFLSLRDLQDVLKTFSTAAPAPGGSVGGFAHLPEAGVVSAGLGGGLAGIPGLMRGATGLMDPHHTMQAMGVFGPGLAAGGGGKLGGPGAAQYAHSHLLHQHAAAAAAAAANNPFGIPGFANPAMASYMAAAAAAAAMPPGMPLSGHPAAAAAALASVFCPQFAAAHHAQQAGPHHSAQQQAFLHHHALQNQGVMQPTNLAPSDPLTAAEDDARRVSLDAATPKPSPPDDAQHPLIQDANWSCGIVAGAGGTGGESGEPCLTTPDASQREDSLLVAKPLAENGLDGPPLVVDPNTLIQDQLKMETNGSSGAVGAPCEPSHPEGRMAVTKGKHLAVNDDISQAALGNINHLQHAGVSDGPTLTSSPVVDAQLMGVPGSTPSHYMRSLAVQANEVREPQQVKPSSSALSASSSNSVLSNDDGSSSGAGGSWDDSGNGSETSDDNEQEPQDGTVAGEKLRNKRKRRRKGDDAEHTPEHAPSTLECGDETLPAAPMDAAAAVAGAPSPGGSGQVDMVNAGPQQQQQTLLPTPNSALPFGFFSGGGNNTLHNAAMAAAAAAGHLHPSYYSLYPTSFHHGTSPAPQQAGGTGHPQHPGTPQQQHQQLLLHHHHQQQQQAHALGLAAGNGSGSAGNAGAGNNAAAAAAAAAALHHSMPFLSQQFGLTMLHPHHPHHAAAHLQQAHHPSHLHHPHHAAAAASGFLPQLQSHHLDLSGGGAAGDDANSSSAAANAFSAGARTSGGGLLGASPTASNALFAYTAGKRHSGAGGAGGLSGPAGLHAHHHHHLGSPNAGPSLLMSGGAAGSGGSGVASSGSGAGGGNAKMTCERGLHYTKCYQGSQDCWIAVWNTKGGRIMHEAFDVSVLGFEGAKNKAREARDAAHSNNVAVSENSRPSWKSHSNTGIPHVSLDSQQLRFRAHKFGRRLCRSFSFGRRRGSYSSRESAFDAAVLWLIQTPTDEEIAAVSGLSAKIEDAM